VFKTIDGITRFRGTYNDGYGPQAHLRVRHTRSIFFVHGRYWVIIDQARPVDNKEHLYEVLFNLNSLTPKPKATGILTRRRGSNLLMVAADQPNQTVEVTQGQIEPVLRGWKRGGETVLPSPTAVVGIRRHGPATVRRPAASHPWQQKNRPRHRSNSYPSAATGTRVAVKVTCPGRKSLVLK